MTATADTLAQWAHAYRPDAADLALAERSLGDTAISASGVAAADGCERAGLLGEVERKNGWTLRKRPVMSAQRACSGC
jgi:hypothetical protein